MGTASASVDVSVNDIVEPVPETQTPEPTTTSAPSVYDIKYLGGAAILYPRVPLMDMNYRPRRYDIQPGAYFPGLEGVKLEEAVHIVATTFPMLSVRAIPDGFPVDLEVRRDRVTLILDPATNYVMDARIG